MSDLVWISDMMADSEVGLTVTNDVSQSNLERFIEGEKLLRKGMPVPQDCCAKRILGNGQAENDEEPVSRVTDLFCANGQYIIAVSRVALDGPDVWMDSSLFKSIFLSGPLGQAISDAGLAKEFRLKRCRVI